LPLCLYFHKVYICIHPKILIFPPTVFLFDIPRAMGAVFNKDMHERYTGWYRSRQGKAIDSALEGLIVSLIDPQPGQRVLDVGCGAGNHLLILNKLGLDVSGIDASPYIIEQARRRLGNRCTLRVCPAEDLPFEDNEFDIVVLINTLEFVQDPAQVLREAGRVAYRHVFIGVFNSLSWSGLAYRIQGRLGDSLFQHVRWYSLWHIKRLLRAVYGDIPISWQAVRLYPAFWDRMRLTPDSSWIGRRVPFGLFLALCATMVYTVKTNNIPLKIRIKEVGQPLTHARVSSPAYPMDFGQEQGVSTHERSLSI